MRDRQDPHIVEQPEHGRDLLVNRYGEVGLTVDHGYGAELLRLDAKVCRAQWQRRYTEAARANARMEALPGFAEAEVHPETDEGYGPDEYPAPECPACDGSGLDADPIELTECGNCRGEGMVA